VPGAATQPSLETLLETRLEPSPAPSGDASRERPDEWQALDGVSSPEVREQSLDAALHGERLDKALVALALLVPAVVLPASPVTLTD
jgi:hypothetical protein